jgi:hypothetical protein
MLNKAQDVYPIPRPVSESITNERPMRGIIGMSNFKKHLKL